MPPRPMLPPDDLYARLQLPVDASYEAVEIAWRALLKQHHPDVAGPAADALAKRINVAHDWLSDPELRTRYDRERHPRVTTVDGPRTRRAGRSVAQTRDAPRTTVRVTRSVRRPVDPAEAIARHLDRVRRLTDDELDRLSLAETAPIAFIATISRFLPADRQEALRALDGRIQDALPRRG